MPINIFRGDAVPVRKIVVVGPPPSDQANGRFEFEIPGSGKYFAVEGWSAADIVAAWPRTIPEFSEITPTVGGNGYSAGALVLTGPSDGTPFSIAVRATGYVSIDTVEEGIDPVNEIQTVTIPESTGGTFTLTHLGQTTADIAYDASAAAVQSALEALSNVAPGDVAVTGFSGGPWAVEWKGAYAAQEVAEMSIDTGDLVFPPSEMIAVDTIREGVAGQSGQIALVVIDTSWLRFTGNGASLSLTPQTSAAEVKAFLDGVTGVTWTITSNSPGWFEGTAAGSPDSTLGDFVLQSQWTPPNPNPGWVTGSPGVAPVNEVQQVTINAGTGTFTLTFEGTETVALDRNATAAEIKTALDDCSSLGRTVLVGTGTNTATQRKFPVEFNDPGSENIPLMTADGSLLNATGTVAESRPHVTGDQESQRITLPDAVTGGTFILTFRADRTVPIAYNASAATVEAALEGIEDIGSGGVSVDGVAGGPWLVTFADNDNVAEIGADASGLTVGTEDLVVLAQAAAGPSHWSDPLNWTLLRAPESGDEVWLDIASANVRHSLRQRTGFSLDDHAKDTLLADGHLHFAEGQKVTLRTTGTLPGGLAAQDYYVREPNEHHRTFKLSATRTGEPVDLTSSAGSGAHTALVELDSLHPAARYNGPLGLPRRNSLGYWEYRPTYLMLGFRPAGAKLVKVGEGEGSGSGRMNVDAGTDQVFVEVVQTGGALESGVPACLILNSNDESTFTQEDGDTGLAAFPGESGEVGTFTVRGGTVFTGEAFTIDGAVRARRGTVAGRYLDSAGVEHRWE